NLIVLCRQHRRQLPGFVVFKVQPGLRVRAPRVLCFEQKISEECHVDLVATLKLAALDPPVPKARYLPVARNFDWIARHTVDPGVADFLCHDWKIGAMRLNCFRNLAQTGCDDLGTWKLSLQFCINGLDLGGSVWSAVVSADDGGDRKVRIGNLCDTAVVMVVHH